MLSQVQTCLAVSMEQFGKSMYVHLHHTPFSVFLIIQIGWQSDAVIGIETRLLF